MDYRKKMAKAEKTFWNMCKKNPKQHASAKKLLQGILLTIADVMITEEDVQIKIGNKTYPDGDTHLSGDEEFINAIMKAKKGTRICLLRDGVAFGSYDDWEVYDQSIKR